MATVSWFYKTFGSSVEENYYEICDKELASIEIQKNGRQLVYKKRLERKKTAAPVIQRKVKKWNAVRNDHALVLQKYYRGYQGRLKYKQEKQRDKVLRDKKAADVQKIVRGFISRRTILDFYSRKMFIEQTCSQLKQQQEVFKLESERQKEEWKVGQVEQLKRKFLKTAKNFHHLLSTKQQMGVYCTPPEGIKDSPKAFDLPVEDYLRQVKPKAKRRVKKILKKRCKETIQASDEYNRTQLLSKEADKENKLKFLTNEGFQTTVKNKYWPYDGYIPGHAKGSPYIDPRDRNRVQRQRFKIPFLVSVRTNQSFD
eukprot:snap_masked-scaffold_49-processed-gene-0.34-mRNA-1 protein AED:0.35 eAED:0.35 QI:0/0/0/0.2/1/1/5/0/312